MSSFRTSSFQGWGSSRFNNLKSPRIPWRHFQAVNVKGASHKTNHTFVPLDLQMQPRLRLNLYRTRAVCPVFICERVGVALASYARQTRRFWGSILGHRDCSEFEKCGNWRSPVFVELELARVIAKPIRCHARAPCQNLLKQSHWLQNAPRI